MKTAHFNLVLIVILFVVGALGYISFSTIRYGAAVRDTKQDSGDSSQEPVVDTTPSTEVPTTAPIATTQDVVEADAHATVPAAYTTLAADIQKLIDDKVQMKAGSSGTRVGTVQTFLNIYDPAGTTPVNNNYGPKTTERTKKFQAEMGVPTTGYAGPRTFTAMLEWLKTKAPKS